MELVASVGRRCCLASRESSGSFPGRRRRQQLLLRHLAQRPRPWHCDGPHHHTRSPPSQRASPRALAVKQERGSNPVGSPSLSLDLNQVREALIRMEDSIIFAIIERSQFLKNEKVYESGAISVPGFSPANGKQHSMVEYLLRETEQMHGRVRRYTSPDEHAFYPDDLPYLVLPPIEYPSLLHPYAENININDQVMKVYFEELLPRICNDGDDGNYGSAALCDIDVLQALSKRIHYGKYVAESKFKDQRNVYEPLIRAKDEAGIMNLLTVESVERRVVRRVRNKACVFGQDIQDVMGTISLSQEDLKESDSKVDPERVAKLYNDWIMPLNKQVQLEYLLHRLDDTE